MMMFRSFVMRLVCPLCDGVGIVMSIKCRLCKGSGEV
jgi:DnaJ-class molecular chaperone